MTFDPTRCRAWFWTPPFGCHRDVMAWRPNVWVQRVVPKCPASCGWGRVGAQLPFEILTCRKNALRPTRIFFQIVQYLRPKITNFYQIYRQNWHYEHLFFPLCCLSANSNFLPSPRHVVADAVRWCLQLLNEWICQFV